MKTLVAKTLKGDARITNTFVNLILRALDLEGAAVATDEPLNADEQETLAVLEERLLRKAKLATNNGGDQDGKTDKS